MTVRKCVKKYLIDNLWLTLLTLFLVLIVIGVSLLPGKILTIIGDNYLKANRMQGLVYIALLYLFTYVMIKFLDFIKQILLINISQGVEKELRVSLINKLHQLSYTEFSSLELGDIEALFNNDVNAIETLITSGIISMTIDLFKVIGIIVMIFTISVYFGILTMILVPIIILIALIMRKLMFNAQLKNRKYEAALNSEVYQNLNNIKCIKAYGIENFILHKFDKTIYESYKVTKNTNYYDSIFGPIMQIIKYGFIVTVIVLSSYYPSLFGISIGVLLGLIEYIISLFSPIESLGQELQTIQKSLAGIKRLNNFFKCKDKEEIIAQEKESKQVIFKDVYFSYEGNKLIFDFNLKLESTDKLTILGESGSGKSTLIKLLTGLITPDKGEVRTFNQNPSQIDDETRRQYFSILFQEPFFIKGTIRDELSFYQKNISDEKIWNSLKMVGLDKRINDLNQIFNKEAFSTGEQVLLNLARVLLCNARIIILDEFNAKLDPLTANHIIEILNEYGQDKMIISISHYGKMLKDSKIIKLS